MPQVKSTDDVKKAVQAAKYPPLGKRSVGIARAQGYSMHFQKYIAAANATIALIIQIEHIAAVNNLNQILKVKGIDGVLIGPYNLAESMGMLGEVTSKRVQETMNQIKEACSQHNLPWGIFVLLAEEV